MPFRFVMELYGERISYDLKIVFKTESICIEAFARDLAATKVNAARRPPFFLVDLRAPWRAGRTVVVSIVCSEVGADGSPS